VVMDQMHVYSDIITLMKTADYQLYKAKENRDCAAVI
jgi:predicted signal transduction protein with EAL and GGDEF domain